MGSRNYPCVMNKIKCTDKCQLRYSTNVTRAYKNHESDEEDNFDFSDNDDHNDSE